MFENPVKQSLSRRQIVYCVLLVLIRGRHLSRSANTVSAENRKFCPFPSYLALLIRVTPFEFMKKLYWSWNYSLPGSRRWRFCDSSLHHFWLIHPCDR